jgi:hypothetical protein
MATPAAGQAGGSGATILKASIGGGSIALSAAFRVSAAAGRVARPIGRSLMSPPGVPRALTPEMTVRRLAVRGDEVIQGAGAVLDRASRELLPTLMDALLDRIDLTELVLQRVDLDRVLASADLDAAIARVDVEALAARLDVTALAARLDPVAIASIIIEAIDLTEILRTSTGSVAAVAVRGARAQGSGAYVQVQRVVDWVPLPRREATPEPDTTDTAEAE